MDLLRRYDVCWHSAGIYVLALSLFDTHTLTSQMVERHPSKVHRRPDRRPNYIHSDISVHPSPKFHGAKKYVNWPRLST